MTGGAVLPASPQSTSCLAGPAQKRLRFECDVEGESWWVLQRCMTRTAVSAAGRAVIR